MAALHLPLAGNSPGNSPGNNDTDYLKIESWSTVLHSNAMHACYGQGDEAKPGEALVVNRLFAVSAP